MRKVYLSLITTFFLTACGGGGSSSDSSTPIIATPSTPTTASSQEIQGDWITRCVTSSDGTSGFATTTFNNVEGVDAFFYGQSSFATSNCSGQSEIIVFGGPVSYRGEFTTSICVAEKVDEEITVISNGETTIEGADVTQFLANNQIQDTIYDIACRLNNQLLLGVPTAALDATTDVRRPIELNTSIPFDVWDRPSARSAANENLSFNEAMTQVSQEIKNIVK